MQMQKINADWRVWKDTDPFELMSSVPADAKQVTLPYDAMFHEAQQPDSINGGSTGFLDGGAYKYAKTLFIPDAWKGEHISLLFEGVYRSASIYINQSLVAHRANGYIRFWADIQDYVKFGTENDLLVVVKCGTQNSRWYSGAGICRDVYLCHRPALSILPDSLRLQTLQADSDGALIRISAEIQNDTLSAAHLNAEILLLDDKGKEVLRRCYPLRIRGHQEILLQKDIFAENAQLWDEFHPNLYTVQLNLLQDGTCADSDSIRSGIRTLCVDARHGLRVNGTPVKLRGACLHHDQGLLGAATYADYEYRRILKLKQAGFNAVRSAHNPASTALLNACDMLGVYVMDELTDIWNKHKTLYDEASDFESHCPDDAAAMVASDFNHPSVILYSTGNEIFEICSEKGFETSRMLTDTLHALDSTRYTTNGVNGVFAAGEGLLQIVHDITDGEVQPGRGDVNVFMGMMATQMPQIVAHPVVGGILDRLETTMDVLGYNYMTARYRKDSEDHPDRVMVGSETYPKQIAENWAAILQCPAVLGDFTWTGWDYLGEVPPVFPALINDGGDLSVIGDRRAASWYRETVFGLRKSPSVFVQNPQAYGSERSWGPWKFTDCVPCWHWPGQEGHTALVQVFAGGDSVELFLNGESMGMQPCGKVTKYEAQFSVPYTPGELIAVAYEAGAEIGRTRLETHTAPIRIAADMPVKTDELIFAEISLLDAQNRLCTDASLPLHIAAEGAELLAFGSNAARHHCGFELPDTCTAEGRALAILRRTGETVSVRISGSGLQPAVLTT